MAGPDPECQVETAAKVPHRAIFQERSHQNTTIAKSFFLSPRTYSVCRKLFPKNESEVIT
jgi:hypothetical protein